LVRNDKLAAIEQKQLEMPAKNDDNTECMFYHDFLPTGSKKPRISAWNKMYELTWHVLVLSKGDEGGNRLC